MMEPGFDLKDIRFRSDQGAKTTPDFNIEEIAFPETPGKVAEILNFPQNIKFDEETFFLWPNLEAEDVDPSNRTITSVLVDELMIASGNNDELEPLDKNKILLWQDPENRSIVNENIRHACFINKENEKGAEFIELRGKRRDQEGKLLDETRVYWREIEGMRVFKNITQDPEVNNLQIQPELLRETLDILDEIKD